ncbi:MAG: recombination protein RecR [Parcubacteria bacterium C7867-005]|nr:MAG: recombination protein RecR [Parcubacteria bacterium C7867-005]
MNSIDKLTEIFAKFPGIGPRQAKRFVYYILSRNGNFVSDLIRAVESLKKEITQCAECLRFFPKNGSSHSLCSICSNTERDTSMLMVVPRDIDLEAVERSGSYKGLYFVLGGSLPILEKEPEKKIRLHELEKIIKKHEKNLKEVILAMNANSEGENTADFIRDKYKGSTYVISELGRGLSTGAELEYADPETLKSAFLHRTK